ncbi:hypothetical protein LCGC14_1293270 [marine sediment metagenome]|uniref:Uncharacterized protein n=1 Tax=marine sediment metagenome TaxID=412755 RepID=A0A0F9KS09_9ZZZZ
METIKCKSNFSITLFNKFFILFAIKEKDLEDTKENKGVKDEK